VAHFSASNLSSHHIASSLHPLPWPPSTSTRCFSLPPLLIPARLPAAPLSKRRVHAVNRCCVCYPRRQASSLNQAVHAIKGVTTPTGALMLLSARGGNFVFCGEEGMMCDSAVAGMYLLVRQMQQLYPHTSQYSATPRWLQKITELAVLLERHRICLQFVVLSSYTQSRAAGPSPVDHIVLHAAYTLDDMRSLSPFVLVMLHRDYRLACSSFALLEHAAPFVDAATAESSPSASALLSCSSSWDALLPALIRSSACVFAYSSDALVCPPPAPSSFPTSQHPTLSSPFFC
jgi:hypothetical protein